MVIGAHDSPSSPPATENPDQYRQLLNNAMFPVVVISLATQRVLYLNDCASRLLALPGDEAVGLSAPDFWIDLNLRGRFVELLTTHREVRNFETRLRTHSNDEIDVRISSNIATFNNEDAIITVFNDITEKTIADQALRKSQKQFQKLHHLMYLLADTVPDMIWAKDLENRYLFANRAICEKLLMCDSETSEALGKTDLFFARRERDSGHTHTFGEICIDSDEVVKTTRKPGRFLEDGLVRGEYLVLDVHKAPLFDTDGNLIGTVGAGRDVTRDMQNQLALKASEQRYRLLAENVQDVIWTMNGDLQFTYVSPSITELTGYTQAEFINAPITSILPPKSMSLYRDFRRAYKSMTSRETGSDVPKLWEFEIIGKDGTPIWVETVASIIQEEKNSSPVVIGVCRNITARIQSQKALERAKEAALSASRVKSEFLANMSHEIRTPMNGILGMLQLLETTPLSGDQQKYVETAMKSGSNLLRLLSDILDFSKIEAGKIELRPDHLALHPFLQSAIHSFESLVDPSRTSLRLEIDKTVPTHIVADETRLQQILFNLLSNGVKFTESGHIILTIKGTPVTPAEVKLSFMIEDTGIGIPENMCRQLFEPFVQADGSFQRKYRGTGLGLSIVKQLVTLMKGDIQLKSEVGRGTTVCFHVTVPVANEPKPEKPTEEPEQSFVLPPMDILVVEDEEINAMVISAMLKNMGHSATIAYNGRHALELLKERTFSCILMDIQMPEMDGIETAGAIRSSSVAGGSEIPIIAVTAHAMKGDEESFLAAGMDDYLTKPVNAAVLAQVLHRVIS